MVAALPFLLIILYGLVGLFFGPSLLTLSMPHK